MLRSEAAGHRSWIILGAGGHARSLADVIVRAGGELVAVAGEAHGSRWSVPVLGSDEEAVTRAIAGGHLLAMGVGDNRSRMALVRSLDATGAQAGSVIGCTATVADDVRVGPATAVLEHAHVGPGVSLGPGVIINTGALVEHDCVVGEGAHVAPGACLLGGAHVGIGALVGSGARVLPGVSVGDGAVVGAGAVVTADVSANQTVTGVPAKPVPT